MKTPTSRQIRAHVVSRWHDDPYSMGAWSLLGVGATAHTREILRRPISPRIALAGEYTNTEQPGMVHGAYEEGQRAADWAIGEGHRSVIVIGAGFAGLGAAARLRDASVGVTVLEARDTIGGRATSRNLGAFTVELGANWLQQGARNPLLRLAKEKGIPVRATNFNAPLDLGPHGVSVPQATQNRIIDRLKAFSQQARFATASFATLVDAFVQETRDFSRNDIERTVDGAVTIDAGLPLSQLSAQAGWEPGVGEGDHWIETGYRSIADVLAEGIDIRLKHPATSVAETPSHVHVQAGRIGFDADAVIIALPAAVLVANATSLLPGIPQDQREALSHVRTGRVEKAVLQFGERWWPRSPSGYLRTFGERPGEIAEWLDMTEAFGEPLIAGIFAGIWAETIWSSPSDATVAQSAANILGAAVDAE